MDSFVVPGRGGRGKGRDRGRGRGGAAYDDSEFVDDPSCYGDNGEEEMEIAAEDDPAEDQSSQSETESEASAPSQSLSQRLTPEVSCVFWDIVFF